jgi:hypothetical protein
MNADALQWALRRERGIKGWLTDHVVAHMATKAWAKINVSIARQSHTLEYAH